VKYSLAVNSGTNALISALIACGIRPGDEVIILGYTFLPHVQQFLLQKRYL